MANMFIANAEKDKPLESSEDKFYAKADFTFYVGGIPVDVLGLVQRHVAQFRLPATFAVTKLETSYMLPGDKTRISVSVVFEYSKVKP